MSRRKFGLLAVLVGVFAMLAAACGSEATATPTPTSSPTPSDPGAPTATPDPFTAEWEALKAEAAEEGELVAFLCCAFGDRIQPFIDEAEEALGIDIVSSTGSSSQQWEKVKAERAANQYTLDVWTGGLNTTNNQLVPGNATRNLKELLFHPEVTDESLWYEGHFWADPEEQNQVFAYGGSASGAEISYNTNLVDPSEITSYWDLLDPKWDGKIVARDPREAGTSQSTALYYLLMGEDFLDQLLRKIVIMDARQAAEQLAAGTYSLCLFACTQEVQAAREDGLPVQEEWPGTVEEGARISTGGNSLVAMDNPKNPAAQKLFVNWFLSRDGQIWWQEITQEQSLRNDIPTDMVQQNSVRKEGAEYLLFERDPNFQENLEKSLEFARRVLAETGQ